MLKTRLILLTAVLLLVSSRAFATPQWLNKIKNAVGSDASSLTSTKLSDTQIGQGLKEALIVGIKNTVAATGKTDGYFKNETIKILMPQQLQGLDKGLRMIGLNQQMDNFVLSMNRAAEKAAPAAQKIFIDSIFEMSIDDVAKIYNGGNTAATNYLKDKTYNKLLETFRPAVTKSLQEYDVTRQYQSLISKYQAIPFSQKLQIPNAENYVVEKTLSGLFEVLGQEEKKIRENPAARTTQILKQVFGSK